MNLSIPLAKRKKERKRIYLALNTQPALRQAFLSNLAITEAIHASSALEFLPMAS
jgi:hypothetical protein